MAAANQTRSELPISGSSDLTRLCPDMTSNGHAEAVVANVFVDAEFSAWMFGKSRSNDDARQTRNLPGFLFSIAFDLEHYAAGEAPTSSASSDA